MILTEIIYYYKIISGIGYSPQKKFLKVECTHRVWVTIWCFNDNFLVAKTQRSHVCCNH